MQKKKETSLCVLPALLYACCFAFYFLEIMGKLIQIVEKNLNPNLCDLGVLL